MRSGVSLRAHTGWLVVVGALACAATVRAQTPGRIFLSTPETVAIYEFNNFEGLSEGSPIPSGTSIADLSGNGLDATFRDCDQGQFAVGPGDPFFDNPAGSNNQCRHPSFSWDAAGVVVENSGDAFEFQPEDDFSVELYVEREIVQNPQDWGMLAGNWHTRNLLDDSVGDPDNNGAWYGFGLVRNSTSFGANNIPTGGWLWVLSPTTAGVPRIGFGQDPEQHVQPTFEIPEGRHYLVLTVDRVAQSAVAYVDGIEVSRREGLGIDWAFTTPDGYDPAEFRMFNGEDDRTRGAYRTAPAGTHIDAVRIQRRALTVDEVIETWDNIQSGIPSPDTGGGALVIVSSSVSKALVGQCVVFSGEESAAPDGETITKWEWKIADGPFVEGASTQEASFDTVSATGHEVTLRITTSGGGSAVGRKKLIVENAPVTTRIAVSLAGRLLPGLSIAVPVGSVLTLDGTGSSTVVPPTALECPISAGQALIGAPITQYLWDLDGRPITTEDMRPSFDTEPYDTPGDYQVRLVVRNEAGSSGAPVIVRIKVVEANRSDFIFHNTDDTVAHFEFGGLAELADGDPLPNGTLIPDVSGNGYDATVEGNDNGDLTIGPGSIIYGDAEPNRAARRTAFTSQNARLAINDDFDAFEMFPEDNFTVELYVDRENMPLAGDWGILAGTWHSRNLQDDGAGDPDNNGAWHGFGLIRNETAPIGPSATGGWSWVLSPVVEGIPRIGFPQQPEQHLQPSFEIPDGLHYVVLSVDRITQTAVGYVDGREVTRYDNLPADWAFTTPDGYDHARFLMFAGEDDPTVGTYRGAPPGAHLDAVRVQRVALTPEEVAENYDAICAGTGANPDLEPPETVFHRGDADDNGQLQLTDAVRILGFLFLGGAAPTCMDAGDADDNGQLQLTDAVRILGFLFLGGLPPAAPGPQPNECGPDPTTDDTLDCASYTKC